jgi:3-phenylpropionate/cinnamic acid dioxygenase small subunit
VTLDDLLARESIRDLVARYNSYGDSGRFDSLRDLFAEHAVMVINTSSGEPSTYQGRDSVMAIFTGARERVKERAQAAGPTYVRHFTATHQIDLVDDDHATGRCYFAVIMNSGLDHWGRYVDRYVRIDGDWKFEDRQVFVEGTSGASWFVS